MNEKTFNKIYLKIDSIAKNGLLGIYDYAKYVDELFTSGQFYILRSVLERKYGVRQAQQMSYQQIKEDVYTKIRFNTLSPFQEAQKSFMDSLSIYQIGQNVYKGSQVIGSITAQTGLSSADLNQVPVVISLSAIKPDNTYINISLVTSILDMYKQAYTFLAVDITTSTTTTSTTQTTTSSTTTTTTTGIISYNVYFNVGGYSGTQSFTNNGVSVISPISVIAGTEITIIPTDMSYTFNPSSITQVINSDTILNFSATPKVNNFGSFKFDGVTPQYLSILNSPDFFPGSNDFTIEWFQNQTENDPYPRAWTIGESPAQFGVSVENGEFLPWEDTNYQSFQMNDWSGIWIHLAMCRLNGVTTIYQDGQIIGSYVDNMDISDTSDNLLIGMDTLYPGLSRFNGYITNFHFVNGTALYNGSFNKPISPISPVLDTKLLLLCEPLHPFKDSSVYNREVDNILGVTWESLNPFVI